MSKEKKKFISTTYFLRVDLWHSLYDMLSVHIRNPCDFLVSLFFQCKFILKYIYNCLFSYVYTYLIYWHGHGHGPSCLPARSLKICAQEIFLYEHIKGVIKS